MGTNICDYILVTQSEDEWTGKGGTEKGWTGKGGTGKGKVNGEGKGKGGE